MKESQRNNKVRSLILKDLNHVFEKHMKPVLGKVLVTVTMIELSADLSIAKAHLSILGKDPKEVLSIVEENNSFIRKHLGNQISNKVRKIPSLKFIWDNSAAKSLHLNKIMKEIGKED